MDLGNKLKDVINGINVDGINWTAEWVLHHNLTTSKPKHDKEAPQVYYHGQPVAALTKQGQDYALLPGDLSKIQNKTVTKEQVQQALPSGSAGSELALPQATTAQLAVCHLTHQYVGPGDVNTGMHIPELEACLACQLFQQLGTQLGSDAGIINIKKCCIALVMRRAS